MTASQRRGGFIDKLQQSKWVKYYWNNSPRSSFAVFTHEPDLHTSQPPSNCPFGFAVLSESDGITANRMEGSVVGDSQYPAGISRYLQ
jgi:hypothetical protein